MESDSAVVSICRRNEIKFWKAAAVGGIFQCIALLIDDVSLTQCPICSNSAFHSSIMTLHWSCNSIATASLATNGPITCIILVLVAISLAWIRACDPMTLGGGKDVERLAGWTAPKETNNSP